MTERTLSFDLCGTLLRARASHDGWTDRLRRQFAAFEVHDAMGPAFELTIHETELPTVDHGLPLMAEARQPDGYFGRAYENDRMIALDVEGGGITVVDHVKRTADAFLRPGSEARFFGTAVMLVIDAALAASGQQLVHGASLIEPHSGRALLIVVPSGGGKTTTSLALAHDGFQLMTDDASVLIPGADRPRIWGLPRALKVHRRTAELLPWVGPLSEKWDENDEQGITPAALGDRIAVAPLALAELGAIMLLGPRSPDRHRVEPVAKSEILIAMSHDNVSWSRSGMTPKARRRFEVFGQAVAQVPAFRISAGTRLAELPALVTAAMNS